MTAKRVFVVQWDPKAAATRARELRAHGWVVQIESHDGGAAYQKVRDKPPAVLLIDISTRVSHGLQTARSIRESKAGRTLPIVFVGGTPKDRAAVKSAVPDALFCDEPALQLLEEIWDKQRARGVDD
jgi:DNA-binding response OmpR family regulator